MKNASLISFLASITIFCPIIGFAASGQVGLYRVFEGSVKNPKNYSNPFTDVDLATTFTSPSGKTTQFFGFFDGDEWKFRFMPEETGKWTYSYKFSDGSLSGSGEFLVTQKNAGKGMLKAYKKNPHWFAYNGTDPVYLKSYYESGSGSIAQDLKWLAENVYDPLIANGYNHFQVNWLMPLCCESGYYHDDGASKPSLDTIRIFNGNEPSKQMNLNVWKMLEDNICYLDSKGVNLHMFVGFDGGQNAGPSWANLSDSEKKFYVKYTMARLAPFENIAVWNFNWEVDGNRTTHELGWARLVKKYDPFGHLVSYEDETPKENEFNRDEYTMAIVENHQIYSKIKADDRSHWTEAWTHHEACKTGYVQGKPVFLAEGNALWRRYWVIKLGTTQEQLRRAAWGCAMAAATFTWCGHSQNPLMARGPEGIPYFGNDNAYIESAEAIDILAETFENDVVFQDMLPADSLLDDQDTLKTWALANPGEEYMVYSIDGDVFSLKINSGEYGRNKWMNTITGDTIAADTLKLAEDAKIKFNAPTTDADWLLIIRKNRPESPSTLEIKSLKRSAEKEPTRNYYKLNGATAGYKLDFIHKGMYQKK